MPNNSSSFCTIPTQMSDISKDLAKLVINQLRLKKQLSPLGPECVVSSFELEDCKKSSATMSTTCRMAIKVETPGHQLDFYFIVKLLPADDPGRLYCFEANVFEKEISIYFELLPCLKLISHGEPKLQKIFSDSIPQCIYGSNNMDGAGVLVFDCALQEVFVHPSDPKGLSLDQLCCVVKLMAKFHAIGSVKLSECHKQMKLRYPYLLSNVYSSPTTIEGAKKMFTIYSQFLKSVPGQQVLVDLFEKHCSGEDGAKQMYSCMRRQVENPFNTIVHGELWEKNMLFRMGEDEEQFDVIVLDWKNAKIASATKDLAFLLLSSTTNEIRKDNLDVILKLYYSTFCETLQLLDVELLKKVTYEEFYRDYTISTKGAFMQAVCVLVQEMHFLEDQLTEDRENLQEIADTLAVYESRALNMMNDVTLNNTHFCPPKSDGKSL